MHGLFSDSIFVAERAELSETYEDGDLGINFAAVKELELSYHHVGISKY